MQKQEFEALINTQVTIDEYSTIDFVYTWHPIIPDVGGKQKIADIYKVGGISLIKDMVKTAQKAKELADVKEDIRWQIESLKLQSQRAEEIFAQWMEGDRS